MILPGLTDEKKLLPWAQNLVQELESVFSDIIQGNRRLHNIYEIGSKELDESDITNNAIITYDGNQNKLKYIENKLASDDIMYVGDETISKNEDWYLNKKGIIGQGPKVSVINMNGHTLYIRSQDWFTLENVEFQNATIRFQGITSGFLKNVFCYQGGGIFFEEYNGEKTRYFQANGVVIINASYGFYFDKALDFYWVNCWANGCTNEGFYLTNATEGMYFANCGAYDDSKGWYIASDCKNMFFSSCFGDSSDSHNWHVCGFNLLFSSAWGYTSTSGYGFYIDGGHNITIESYQGSKIYITSSAHTVHLSNVIGEVENHSTNNIRNLNDHKHLRSYEQQSDNTERTLTGSAGTWYWENNLTLSISNVSEGDLIIAILTGLIRNSAGNRIDVAIDVYSGPGSAIIKGETSTRETQNMAVNCTALIRATGSGTIELRMKWKHEGDTSYCSWRQLGCARIGSF